MARRAWEFNTANILSLMLQAIAICRTYFCVAHGRKRIVRGIHSHLWDLIHLAIIRMKHAAQVKSMEVYVGTFLPLAIDTRKALQRYDNVDGGMIVSALKICIWGPMVPFPLLLSNSHNSMTISEDDETIRIRRDPYRQNGTQGL